MRINAEGKNFPVNNEGFIVSPRYTPSPEYRERVVEWVRANPDRIPAWLKADMELMRGGKRRG